MANEEQLAVLKKGVKEWNEWRILNNPVVDLSSADLSGLDLGSVNVFTHADLHNSILTDTDMSWRGALGSLPGRRKSGRYGPLRYRF